MPKTSRASAKARSSSSSRSVVRASGFVVVKDDSPPHDHPIAPGAEGSYEDGFGSAQSVDEFYDSIDELLSRVRSRAT